MSDQRWKSFDDDPMQEIFEAEVSEAPSAPPPPPVEAQPSRGAQLASDPNAARKRRWKVIGIALAVVVGLMALLALIPSSEDDGASTNTGPQAQAPAQTAPVDNEPATKGDKNKGDKDQNEAKGDKNKDGKQDKDGKQGQATNDKGDGGKDDTKPAPVVVPDPKPQRPDEDKNSDSDIPTGTPIPQGGEEEMPTLPDPSKVSLRALDRAVAYIERENRRGRLPNTAQKLAARMQRDLGLRVVPEGTTPRDGVITISSMTPDVVMLLSGTKKVPMFRTVRT